jgi:hypothetical protein
MPKLQVGKETVKFLAVFDHNLNDQSLITNHELLSFNDLTFQRFNDFFASQTQSKLVKPNPTTAPLLAYFPPCQITCRSFSFLT